MCLCNVYLYVCVYLRMYVCVCVASSAACHLQQHLAGWLGKGLDALTNRDIVLCIHVVRAAAELHCPACVILLFKVLNTSCSAHCNVVYGTVVDVVVDGLGVL